MKWLSLILSVTIFNIAIAGDNFKTSLQTLIEKNARISSSEQHEAAADEFKQLYMDHPTEWLPLYYAGYHFIFAAEYNTNKDYKEEQLHQAEKMLNEALSRNKENSELHALKAFMLIKKMQLPNSEPVQKSEIENSLDLAKKYDANNPRAYLISGIYAFYFKNPGHAEPELKKALNLFDRKEKAQYPDWGKNLATSLSKKL